MTLVCELLPVGSLEPKPLAMATLEHLGHILAERYRIGPEAVRPDQSIKGLGLDSLEITEFLFVIEEDFAITMPERPAAFRTLGDVVRCIDDAVAQKQVASARRVSDTTL